MKNKRSFIGQSLVEVAIIIPIVIFLITGFLDLGRAIFYYSSVTNMAREGARAEIINTNFQTGPFLDTVNRMNGKAFGVPNLDTTPSSCVSTYDCTFINSDVISATITRNLDITGKFFETVKVTVTYNFKPITPGLQQIFGYPSGLPLRAQSVMRISASAR